MRFGFESEKIIFDLRARWVSDTALRTLQALEDYRVMHGEDQVKRVTGEFVQSMIELVSSPASDVYAVAKDYLISYELSREVSARGRTFLLPFGAFPVDYEPIMVAKFQYFLKNAILSNTTEVGWELTPEHRLYDAANCAGVHVHGEIATLPEYLTFTRELMDKHNAALAIAPLMAFAASPYFNGVHSAMSMRAKRYYHGVYKDVPEVGGFPPMATSSAEHLQYYLTSMKVWDSKGIALGFDADEIRRLSTKSGANWGLVRWNRKWNTIELRCFDSDFVGMDLAKFTITSRALKRFDPSGERLQTSILGVEITDHTATGLDELLAALVPQCWEVSGREVAVLPTQLMHRLINLGIEQGLQNPLVYQYVERLVKFARKELTPREEYLAHSVIEGLRSRSTTSDCILRKMNHAKTITREEAIELSEWMIAEETSQYESLIRHVPTDVHPPRDHPFPSAMTVSPQPLTSADPLKSAIQRTGPA